MSGANRGIRQGEVHPAFAKRPKDLRNQAKEMKADYVGNGQRPWQIPREVGEPVDNPNFPPRVTPPHPVDPGGALETDLLKIQDLHKAAFERPQMNANYAACMKELGLGTTGDIQSLKYQIDYNAMEERAFRMRHMTSCRGMAHAMCRRRGHGEGRVFENVEKQAADMIRAGGVKAEDGATSKPPALAAADQLVKPPDIIA